MAQILASCITGHFAVIILLLLPAQRRFHAFKHKPLCHARYCGRCRPVRRPYEVIRPLFVFRYLIEFQQNLSVFYTISFPALLYQRLQIIAFFVRKCHFITRHTTQPADCSVPPMQWAVRPATHITKTAMF